jgi:hypothetical protein
MTEQLEEELRILFHEDALRAPGPESLAGEARRLTRRRRRIQFAWGGAGAAAAASVALAAVLVGGGQLVGESSLEELTARPPAISGQGAVPDSGMASCVESYDAGNPVTGRAFAFDGTVAAIGPAVTDRDGLDSGLAGVRFEVNEWFDGGSAATVVVDLTKPDLSGLEEFPPAYGVGTRLLVSGEPRWGGAPLDDPIAWGCGFTRYYDEATADSWRAAFGG